MSAPKHTPGPWTVGGIGSVKGTDSSDIFIQDRRGASIAHVIYNEPGGDDPAECMADARLIAAAPDLLEALKEIIDFIGPKDPVCIKGPNCETCRLADAARAAITKAEGGAS